MIERAEWQLHCGHRDDAAPARDPARLLRAHPARHAPAQDHSPRRVRPRRLDLPVLRRRSNLTVDHVCRAPRAARRAGRTSSPPARRATAARATRCPARSACTSRREPRTPSPHVFIQVASPTIPAAWRTYLAAWSRRVTPIAARAVRPRGPRELRLPRRLEGFTCRHACGRRRASGRDCAADVRPANAPLRSDGRLQRRAVPAPVRAAQVDAVLRVGVSGSPHGFVLPPRRPGPRHRGSEPPARPTPRRIPEPCRSAPRPRPGLRGLDVSVSGGAFVVSWASRRAETSASAWTAAWKASSLALEGLVKPLILRTYWSAEASTSSAGGGSKL